MSFDIPPSGRRKNIDPLPKESKTPVVESTTQASTSTSNESKNGQLVTETVKSDQAIEAKKQENTEKTSARVKTEAKPVRIETNQLEKRNLQFEESDSGEMIIKVINPVTEEIIRRIPNEELQDVLNEIKNLNGSKGGFIDTEL